MTKKSLQWEVQNSISEPVSKAHICADIINYAACASTVALCKRENETLSRMEWVDIYKERLEWLNKEVYTVLIKLDGRTITGYYNVSEMKRGATPNLSWRY